MENIFKIFLIFSVLPLSSCSDYTSNTLNRLPSNPVIAQGHGDNNPLPDELKSPNEGNFSEEKMLVNIGINIIAKNVQDFSLQVSLLKNRIKDYCEDLESGINDTPVELQVKNQWTQAMLAYHLVDAAPVGPLSDNGRYYADNIYSWPFVNTCGIDNDVAVEALTAKSAALTTNNRKGLAALEYLLFTPAETEKCNLTLAINKNVVEWLKRSPQQRKKDRCVRARAIAADLDQKTQELWRAWDPERGNFTKTMIDGSRYASVKEAINALTDSLFSIESIKDTKLGIPLGKTAACTSADKKCPESSEHIWSGLAFSAISMQLSGFRAVIYGSTNKDKKAFGFDDYLAAKGFSDSVQKMDEILMGNIQDVQKISEQGTIVDQIQKMDVASCAATTLDNPAVPLCHLYTTVRKLANTFKSEVLTVLALQTPASFQGDND